MKNFKKVIASLTSAAMVFGMVSLTPMSSVAAVTLPDVTGQWTIYNNSPDFFEPDNENSCLVRFGSGAGTATVDNITVDSTSKTITFKNLETTRMDIDAYKWTLVFEGTNTISTDLAVENFHSGEEDNFTTFKLAEGATLTVTSKIYGHAVLGANTTSDVELDDTPEIFHDDYLGVDLETYETTGPIVISGPSTNTTNTTDDDDDATTTDDDDTTTTDDTTTDDATTDDTTSDDTSDDEATTGDSSDGETESPNVIEGKDLSWNTVDSTGKSYWYENGVKQGTVDDPKAVSYDGAVRGREIYDPESKEWYWLDANSNGARAVNKEVFVPYIYQDQSKLSADDIKALAKLSDNGLDGVGGTVYSAMINKTGKWIRYDAKGAMIKGWYTVEGADAELYPSQKGNTYYYDTKTGTMAKGDCVIDGVLYHFDGLTGALKK